MKQLKMQIREDTIVIVRTGYLEAASATRSTYSADDNVPCAYSDRIKQLNFQDLTIVVVCTCNRPKSSNEDSFSIGRDSLCTSTLCVCQNGIYVI